MELCRKIKCSCPLRFLLQLRLWLRLHKRARQSPSCCHSLFLAESATGGARKRPQLRHTPKNILFVKRHGNKPHPKYEKWFDALSKAHNILIIYEKKAFVKEKINIIRKKLKIFQKISKKVLTFQNGWYIMINVAGDELECLPLSGKCESGGTGRRARLRGVWIHRTGSSPVSRTKDCFKRNSPFFFCSVGNCAKSLRRRTRNQGRTNRAIRRQLSPAIRRFFIL